MDCVVVMGVSGSGKTTIGRGIAAASGWRFAEGDDFHPPANVAKMESGVPLDDEDRQPWLEALAGWIDEAARSGTSAVVTCSALRRPYRDFLRDGRAWVRFCHIDVPEPVLVERLARRADHYMPASLLASQLALLEPLEADEPGVVCAGEGTPEEVLARALSALGLAG